MNKKLRVLTLGTLRPDGGDFFAVVDSTTKISFREMLEGFKVVEYSAYSKQKAQIKQLKVENASLREAMSKQPKKGKYE